MAPKRKSVGTDATSSPDATPPDSPAAMADAADATTVLTTCPVCGSAIDSLPCPVDGFRGEV